MRMRVLGTLLTAAAISTAGIAAPAQAAEGQVFGADADGAIPGQYIVTLKGTSTGVGAQSTGIGAQSTGIGGQSTGETTYVKRMTAVEARRLAAKPNVEYVEQDRVLHAAATQRNPTWGLDRIDQRATKPSRSYTPMDDGSAVHAY